MALPAGCKQVCRPNRSIARHYTAKDVGRIACLAREAGESNQDILAELGKCLQLGECDCERIGQKIALAVAAVGILATIALSRGRANQLAAEETAALMERLRASSSTVPVGSIKILENVQGMLALGADSDRQMNAAFAELLDSLRGIEQDSFAQSPDIVIIQPSTGG